MRNNQIVFFRCKHCSSRYKISTSILEKLASLTQLKISIRLRYLIEHISLTSYSYKSDNKK